MPFDPSRILNGTTYRINDPAVSVPFYKDNFGFELVNTAHFDGYDVYSLAIGGGSATARQGVIHLKHTPSKEQFKANNGNGEHRGFGHICISVDNIVAAEKRLLDNDVLFKKKLSDGRQKDIAFVLDPDGYWIELIENGINKKDGVTDLSTYKFNHSMIRVKDPVRSIGFYKTILGFKLVSKMDFPEAEFTLYFLAYEHDGDFKEGSEDLATQARREGVLELTHNYGTETQRDFKYHNGNTTENGATTGFSHITIGTDKVEQLVETINTKLQDPNWITPTSLYDPDHYVVDIVAK